MATIKRRLYRKNASGSYDTVHYESESSLILRPSGRTVEQDLADFLPKTQASDSPPASLKSLLGGTSKIWAGTNSGTVKELSLSGHTHSASDITSGTLSVSRGGTGYTSLSSLASALSSYLPSSGGKTSLFNKAGTVSVNNSRTNIGTVYNCNLYDFIIITISGSLSTSTVIALYIGGQAALGFNLYGSLSFGTYVYTYSKYLSGFDCTNEIYTGSTLGAGGFPGNSSMSLELYANSSSNVNVSYNIQIQGAKL